MCLFSDTRIKTLLAIFVEEVRSARENWQSEVYPFGSPQSSSKLQVVPSGNRVAGDGSCSCQNETELIARDFDCNEQPAGEGEALATDLISSWIVVTVSEAVGHVTDGFVHAQPNRATNYLATGVRMHV